MAKKLISFLGTNKYLAGSYFIGDQVSTPQNFIQAALIEIVCKDWTAKDEIIILLTKEAKEKNWIDNNSNGYLGLNKTLQNLNTDIKITAIDLDDATQELDHWDHLFNVIFDCIDDEDEIYFDVTHGFRALPFLAQTMLSFTKLLKNTVPKSVFYGNFGVLGSYLQAKELPLEERLAPIIDLKGIYNLEKWTAAVDNFASSGDMTLLNEIVETSRAEYNFKDKDERHTALTIGNFIKALTTLTMNLNTVRMESFPSDIKMVFEAYEKFKALPSEKLGMLDKLLDRFDKELSIYNGDNIILDTLSAIEWCVDKGLIQQGYTILEEGLRTVTAFAVGLDHESFYYLSKKQFKAEVEDRSVLRKEIRNHIGGLFHSINMNEPLGKLKWLHKTPCVDQFKLLEKHYSFLKEFRDYFGITSTVNQTRNNINHAGMAQSNKLTAEKLKSDLSKYVEEIRPYFEAMAIESQKYTLDKVIENMQVFEECLKGTNQNSDNDSVLFVLLSHQLNEQQIEDAKDSLKVSDIVYLPTDLQAIWSNVDPFGDFDRSILDPIFNYIADYPTIKTKKLLVQGELSATINMVDWANRENYLAYYATTKRCSEDMIDAEGTVYTNKIFEHVQFRLFPQN